MEIDQYALALIFQQQVLKDQLLGQFLVPQVQVQAVLLEVQPQLVPAQRMSVVRNFNFQTQLLERAIFSLAWVV